jgi:hypothetical protein
MNAHHVSLGHRVSFWTSRRPAIDMPGFQGFRLLARRRAHNPTGPFHAGEIVIDPTEMFEWLDTEKKPGRR